MPSIPTLMCDDQSTLYDGIGKTDPMLRVQTLFPVSTWQEAVEACKLIDVSAA